MLNLGYSIDVSVNKHQIPFYFDRRNECVACGGKNTLVFIDKFGRPNRHEIRAFDHIVCTRCNRVYSILWKSDGSKMYPSAIDPDISRDFYNLVNHSKIKKNGVRDEI